MSGNKMGRAGSGVLLEKTEGSTEDNEDIS